MTQSKFPIVFPISLPEFMPAQRDTLYLIDPLAFFCALVGAPILVALLGFWVFLIPVAAVVFGGPVYLILGTPALLWSLGRRRPNAAEIAGLAFLVNAFGGVALLLASLLIDDADTRDLAFFYTGFGSVIAPVWGATFSRLYTSIESSFYKNTNS